MLNNLAALYDLWRVCGVAGNYLARAFAFDVPQNGLHVKESGWAGDIANEHYKVNCVLHTH